MKIKKLLASSAVGSAAYFAGTAAAYLPFVVSDALKEHGGDCGYLMILGANVIGEDTPSLQLISRMFAAADYLDKHPDTFAVPCGGCFREGQKKAEADIIADYLIAHGVSPDRILPERESTTTFENFAFAKKIIEAHSGRPIADVRVGFVTNAYHIFRSGVIAGKYGFKDIVKVPCPTPGNKIKPYIREYFVGYALADAVIRHTTPSVRNKTQ